MKMSPAFKRRGIMAIVAVLIGFILAAIMTNDSMNILTTNLPDLRGWSQTMITSPTSVGGWLALIVTVAAGTFINKIGSYNCMKIAYIILGIALIVVGLSSNYTVYFVAMVITRCAQALGFFASVKLTTDWFLEYRGRALGIVTMGPPISSAILVPTLQYVTTNLGFNVAWIGLGCIGILFAVVLFFFGKSTPEDYGWQQDGYNRSPEMLAKMGMTDDTPNVWSLPRMLKKKEYWILTVSGALGGMTFGTGLMLFIPVVTSAGVESGLAFLMFSIGSALAIPFSFISGVIDDKLGTKTAYLIILAFTVIMPLSFVLLIVTGAFPIAILCAFCVGVLAGCLMNLNPSIKQWAFGRRGFVDFNRTAQAVENACQTLGVLILSLFFDATGTYLMGFILFAVMMAAVFIAVLFLRSHAPEVIGLDAAQESAGMVRISKVLDSAAPPEPAE